MPSSKTGAINARSRLRGNSLVLTYNRLRELIVRGRLAPGSRLVESELADRLGVSRTPVRGALSRLQGEGYITVIPGTNHRTKLAVSPLTKDDAYELYWITGHVEGLAARLTAQLDPSVRTPLIGKLKQLNASLLEMAETRRQDPDRIFELDLEFHRSIVEASAGPRLLALHNSIKPQTERYWRLYASAILDQLQKSVDEHNRIIAALEAGDANAAEEGIRTNWLKGAERLASVIDALGERGSW